MKLSKLDRGPFDHSGHKLMRSDLFWFSFLGMIPLIRSTLPKPQTLFKFLSLNDFIETIKIGEIWFIDTVGSKILKFLNFQDFFGFFRFFFCKFQHC